MRAFRPLACRDAFVGRLDPVADGVPNQVEDGIHHPLDEELVDLGRLPGQFELHALLAVAREIAHDERHPAENPGNRHEPHAHDAFAQVADLPFDALGFLLQPAPFRRRQEPLDAEQPFLEPRPGDDEVADQPHQVVEPGQIDADEIRLRGRCVGRPRHGGREPGDRVERFCRGRIRQPFGRDPVGRERREGMIARCRHDEIENDPAAGGDARHDAVDSPDLRQACAHGVHLDAARHQLRGRRERDLPQMAGGLSG